MHPRLRSQYDALATRRAKLEAAAEELSEAQLHFRPTPGSWSIAEVANHLLRVEREVTRAAAKHDVIRRGRRRTPREWIGLLLFHAVVRLNLRIRVPAKVAGLVTPPANPDVRTLWSEWRDVHRALENYLEKVEPAQLRDMAFKHPVVGPVSVKGMVPFLTRHFDHHMRQIRRIQRNRLFPAA